MGEASEGAKRLEMEELFNRYPRDLLQRFMASSGKLERDNDEEEEEKIELNLGLSLGGRFGVDKKQNKLIRSNSVACSIPMIKEVADVMNLPPVMYPALIRTSSLPTGTEEEWRKRKELQTLRRMEAKRRRADKQKCSIPITSEKDSGKGFTLPANNAVGLNRFGPQGFPNWTAASKQTQLSDPMDVSSRGGSGGSGGCPEYGQPNSQGSMESPVGSSSGMSDFSSKQIQGSSSGGESKSSATRSEVATEIRAATVNMPSVFTKGGGPNGKRVNGILYKYGQGEQVRILCVCHGSFLSPAEFVMHAGGGEVAHPLRHIVINPSSNSFL